MKINSDYRFVDDTHLSNFLQCLPSTSGPPLIVRLLPSPPHTNFTGLYPATVPVGRALLTLVVILTLETSWKTTFFYHQIYLDLNVVWSNSLALTARDLTGFGAGAVAANKGPARWGTRRIPVGDSTRSDSGGSSIGQNANNRNWIGARI